MQQLSLFRGVHDTQPRPVTLEELVTMMRTDQSVRDLTEKHRYARYAGDEQGASRYKKMMTSFGVAARFEGGRQQKHIVEFTGLSLVDIDHIAPERMTEILEKVREDEHTLLAYTTLSGQGLRVLTRYALNDDDNVDVDLPSGRQLSSSLTLSSSNYKQAFLTVNNYYQNLTGLATDHQCKNIGRISTIAYDENLYYNPEATPFIIKLEEKKPVGRPKGGKSEKGSVKRCKVGEVEAIVQRELERRGIVYEAGTYNKYVSAFCYEMNRYGVPEEECRKWAVNRFEDYNTPEVEAIVRSCYQQTEEHGTARVPRQRQSNQATVADIQRFLTDSGVRVRYNVITRKREMGTPSNLPLRATLVTPPSLCDTPSINRGGVRALQASLYEKNAPVTPSIEGGGQGGGSAFIELTDDHVNSLYCRFCLSTGLTTRPKEFNTIIESDFYPTYNPLHEYLDNLPAWDGTTDYIDLLASTVHVTGCTQEMHNRFFKKWIVAMVAAWMDESVTNHEILTYIGPQGRYKTTFMTRLLPPVLGEYFATKTFKGRMDKDDRLALTELALIDLEELDVMNASEVNQLKALVTDPSVNLRPVYARYSVRRAHIASFCGTGNNPRFLTDLTGHRRWLPFMIEAIDSPYEYPFDYEGIYAQAYALYREGFRYWFTDEENAELEQHNRQFEEPCIEEELIRTYLRQPYGEETGEFLTATRIIELVGTSVRVSLSPKRIAMAMQRLGYEQRRVMNTRGWNVVILTGDQIKEQQRMDAHRSNIE